MSDTHFKISCWLRNFRGNSFCIELDEQKDSYKVFKQEEKASPIRTIREQGAIDRSKPYSEFKVDSKTVVAILDDLRLEKVSLVPDFTGGFDGVYKHIRIQNGESIIHLTWWSDSPKEWVAVQRAWQRFVELAQ